MDVIFAYYTLQYLNIQSITGLTKNIAATQLNITG
jgi:hypothetical protein